MLQFQIGKFRMKKMMIKSRDKKATNSIYSDLIPAPQNDKIDNKPQPSLNFHKQVKRCDTSFPEDGGSPYRPLPRKNEQINNLHQQFQFLKGQIQYIPQKNSSVERHKGRDKQIEKQIKDEYVNIEDHADNDPQSQSCESVVEYQKTDIDHNRKGDSHQLSLFSKSGLYLQQNIYQKQSQIQKNDFSQDQSNESKQKESSVQNNNYANKLSVPLPSRGLPLQNRLTFNQNSSNESPIIERLNRFITPQQSNKSFSKPVLQSFSINSQLKHFSFFIDSNMQTIVDKLQEVEKKYLSLDLYFEELKQNLLQRKISESQSKQIWQAKDRQFKFVISQHESKIHHLKAQNERLEKQLANIKIKQQNNRTKIKQYDSKFTELDKVEYNLDRLRKSKVETDKKLIQIDAKAKKLQKEKKLMEEELQRCKRTQKERSIDSRNQRSSLNSSSLNNSHIQKTATLMRQEMEYLRQRISSLQRQNKQYEKQKTNKQYEIVGLIKNCSQNKMMLEKVKEMNLQLQNQCNALQKQKVQKELQNTENLCRINLNVKKKLKQYDNFKNSVIQSLDEIVKKIPKKIRKIYYGELINKNRTNKCQILFKCMNQFVTGAEEHHTVLSTVLQNTFSISSIQFDKIGLEGCFNKIKNQITNLQDRIQILKNQNYEIMQENKKIKEDLKQRQLSLQNMSTKLRERQENDLVFKMGRQSIKNIPSNDVEISKPMNTINQQLIKKKAEVDKLNKEVLKLIQQSHSKYLGYEERIAEIELNCKHITLKNVQIESDRQDLMNKITEKDNLVKATEKMLAEVKSEKEGFNLKFSELVNQNKKNTMELQIKIRKLENQNQISKKSMKKAKIDFQMNEKTISTKLLMKDKAINDLLQQKNNLIVQLKIAAEKLQFAKVLEQTKLLSKKQEDQAKNQIAFEDIVALSKQVEDMSNQILSYQTEVKDLANTIKENNINLSDKDKQLEKLLSELRKKEEQIEKNNRENKEKQGRKNQIQEEYKKIIEQLKLDKEQNEKRNQQRNKEFNKLLKQFQQKSEEHDALTKQKKEDFIKLKDFDTKMSQNRRQNDELLKMLRKKEQEIDQKDRFTEEERERFIHLQQKNEFIQKQLKLKQQNQQQNQNLRSQLQKQNSMLKDQLTKKEEEILDLIKQRQELNFKLSEDMDAKNQSMKFATSNLENKITIMKERCDIMEINLMKAQQQSKKKDELIMSLEQHRNQQQKMRISANDLDKQYNKKIKQYQQGIQDFNHKIQILQKEFMQEQNKNKSMQQQLQRAKVTQNQYNSIIQQKQILIQQLEEQISVQNQEIENSKNNTAQKIQINKKYQKQIQELKRQLQQKRYKNECLMEELMKTNKKRKENLGDKQIIQQYKLEIQQKQKINQQLLESCQNNKKLLDIKQKEFCKLQQQFQILKTKAKNEIQAKQQYFQTIMTQKDTSESNLKKYIQNLQIKQKLIIQQASLIQKEFLQAKKDATNWRQKTNELQNQLKIKQAELQDFINRHEQLKIHSNQEMIVNSSSERDPNIETQLDKSFDNIMESNEQEQDENNNKNMLLQQPEIDFNSIDFDLPKKSSMKLFDQFQNKQMSQSSKIQEKKEQIVQQEIEHQTDQTFQICEENKINQPSENIKQNVLIHSSYLLKLKKQLNQILNNKQQSFDPSFYNLHSNSALEILEGIKFQLIEHKNGVNQTILQQLAFIEKHEIDFCDNIQPQLEEYFKHLERLCISKQRQINDERRVEYYSSELQKTRSESQTQIKRHIQRLHHKDEEIIHLNAELNTIKKQMNVIQAQIKELIDQKQEEQEQNQKKFMKQSSIFKEEIMKEKSRADKYFSSFQSIRKINDKILDILFSKEDLRDELSDCFEHLSRVCTPKDEQISTKFQKYIQIYSGEKEKAKKKKGWF